MKIFRVYYQDLCITYSKGYIPCERVQATNAAEAIRKVEAMCFGRTVVAIFVN